MLRLVTVCRPAKVFYFYSGHPDVCSAIIIIKHLGAVIGSREHLEEYVSEKVTNWVSEITKLAEFALSQPQACYAAYSFGLKHRWTYFLRTLPDIQELLEPLDNAISKVLIPAITEHRCTPLDRNILALPVRLGGLA